MMAMVLALGSTSCLPTVRLLTPYKNRRPAQDKWLIVDGVVVGSGVVTAVALAAQKDPNKRAAASLAVGGSMIWLLTTYILLSQITTPAEDEKRLGSFGDPPKKEPIKGGVVKEEP